MRAGVGGGEGTVGVSPLVMQVDAGDAVQCYRHCTHGPELNKPNASNARLCIAMQLLTAGIIPAIHARVTGGRRDS